MTHLGSWSPLSIVVIAAVGSRLACLGSIFLWDSAFPDCGSRHLLVDNGTPLGIKPLSPLRTSLLVRRAGPLESEPRGSGLYPSKTRKTSSAYFILSRKEQIERRKTLEVHWTYASNQETQTPFKRHTQQIIGWKILRPLFSLDGEYYRYLTRTSLTYSVERLAAFAPGYPLVALFLTRNVSIPLVCALCKCDPHRPPCGHAWEGTIESITLLFLSNVSLVLGTVALYYVAMTFGGFFSVSEQETDGFRNARGALRRLVGHIGFPGLAALLYCFGTANPFYSAGYTESFFGLLSATQCLVMTHVERRLVGKNGCTDKTKTHDCAAEMANVYYSNISSLEVRSEMDSDDFEWAHQWGWATIIGFLGFLMQLTRTNAILSLIPLFFFYLRTCPVLGKATSPISWRSFAHHWIRAAVVATLSVLPFYLFNLFIVNGHCSKISPSFGTLPVVRTGHTGPLLALAVPLDYSLSISGPKENLNYLIFLASVWRNPCEWLQRYVALVMEPPPQGVPHWCSNKSLITGLGNVFGHVQSRYWDVGWGRNFLLRRPERILQVSYALLLSLVFFWYYGIYIFTIGRGRFVLGALIGEPALGAAVALGIMLVYVSSAGMIEVYQRLLVGHPIFFLFGAKYLIGELGHAWATRSLLKRATHWVIVIGWTVNYTLGPMVFGNGGGWS